MVAAELRQRYAELSLEEDDDGAVDMLISVRNVASEMTFRTEMPVFAGYT